ncbi:integrase arm-type DNA-binding domain-containing protein [Methylobacterium sp. EM32]|uniref:integrase arm-type DNA-binding domain-containing protein n=1 Tax=Methylobacterium sp. EM32 TaxID=3163481 RepID=UPI0033B44808
MPSLLLTPELVTKLVGECLPGMKKPRDVIDRGCVGLALRLRPRGATWSFKMVRGGEERRIKIGTPAAITLDQARAIAAAARRDVNNRIAVFDGDAWLHKEFIALGLSEPTPPPPERDPQSVATFEEALEDMNFWTWEQAREAYLAEVKRTRRPDTWNDYRAMLHVEELAPLGGLKVRRITRSELSVIVAEMHESGRERHAEHLASVLRPMWTYLTKDHIRPKSGLGETQTMAGLRAPERSAGGAKPRANGKVPGTYVATPAEVGFLVAASRVGAIEGSLAVAMELLVMTGQRRRPISSALVEDFVPWVENPGWGVWSMGPAHRKTADRREDRHRHCIPLPPALWDRIQVQTERARAAKSPYLFPQIKAARKGGRVDGHMNAANMNHRLLDMDLRASPHDIRRCLTNTCQKRFRIARSDVKLVVDHAEGISSTDVLEGHYTDDDRLDLKAPLMERYVAWVDEQAATATLPPLAELRREIARRRREREAEGKLKTAARKAAKEEAEKAKVAPAEAQAA